ncbi:hypothetical protein M434DRAFT_397249 [Hypoxylon sp. CO27-5]|nr:hypothetical protein M434DRAFT_397249 [Hypoxylon sp. CO27-5]
MSSLHIPGYYYDPVRRRYFRVERRQTAPSNAPWSSDEVKRRETEAQTAAAELRRATLNQNRITRSMALNVPIMGGFLAREYGQHIYQIRDLCAASFAQGITSKGKRPLKRHVCGAVNIKQMAIVPKHPEHPVCTAYIHVSGGLISSAPLPRDKNGSFHDRTLFTSCHGGPMGCLCPQREEWIDHISDIKYSKKAGLVLVSSRNPRPRAARLHVFAPKRRPCMTFARPMTRMQAYREVDSHKYLCNTICPAPSTSNQICLIGTDMGVAQFDSNFQLKLLASPTWSLKTTPDAFCSVFTVNYHANNPDIIFFGGRPGILSVGDLRQDVNRWSSVNLTNSISHIKTVSEHQVLVAGLRNTLSVFDLRYCDLSQVRQKHDPQIEGTAKPVVTVQGYKNAARFDVGLDYDPGSGVIAAAEDSGKVALYSVRTGHRLPSRDIDKIYSPFGAIRQLRFETFDGDKTPSLFVAERAKISVYSFGVDNPDDEA